VGTKILALASDFERANKNMASIQDCSMLYVEKILQTQYPDKNVLDSILNSICMESDSLIGLNVFTTESIKRAKYIDAQVSSDS
jgi:hypothetical protein